jgi:hypothetical protein
MKLSEHFALSEFLYSKIADRNGIDNTTSDQQIIDNLTLLCMNVLEPIRNKFGVVHISSGYRCLQVNRILKSQDTSQHVKGEAADLYVDTASKLELARWIRDNLTFDQVILEFVNPSIPSSGWVHVSYSRTRNRKQALTINSSGTSVGF